MSKCYKTLLLFLVFTMVIATVPAHAWEEGDIMIYADGETHYYNGTSPVANSYSTTKYVGIDGNNAPGAGISDIKSIKTGDASTSGQITPTTDPTTAYISGIYYNGSGHLSINSLVNGIDINVSTTSYTNAKLYGINATGGGSTTVNSLGGITLVSVNKMAYGIGTSGADANFKNTVTFSDAATIGVESASNIVYGMRLSGLGKTEIYNLGGITATTKGTAQAYGICINGSSGLKNTIEFSSGAEITARSKTNSKAYGISEENYGDTQVIFNGTGGSITALGHVDGTGSSSAYGVYMIGSEKLTVKNLNGITAEAGATGGAAYGIDTEAGTTNVTFSGAGSIINAQTTAATTAYAYGIETKGTGSKTTVNGLGGIIITTTSGTNNAYGIRNEGSATETTVNFSNGAVINLTSAQYAYGVFGLGTSDKTAITGLGGITAKAGATGGGAKGIYAKGATMDVTFSGADSYIKAVAQKATAAAADATGIYAMGTGTTTVRGLAGIEAKIENTSGLSAEIYASGIRSEGTSDEFKNTVNFYDGAKIVVSGAGDYAGASGVHVAGTDGETTVTGLGGITATTSSTKEAYGIYTEAGTTNVTFSGAGSFINARTIGNVAAYGICAKGTGTTTVNGLGGITAITTATGVGYVNPFGVYSNGSNTNFANTVNFSDGAVINVSSAKWSYGVYAIGTGTTKITGLGGITANTTTTLDNMEAYGIYSRPTANGLSNTVEFSDGAMIMVTCDAPGDATAYGINMQDNATAYSGETNVVFGGSGGSIMAFGSNASSAYGIKMVSTPDNSKLSVTNPSLVFAKAGRNGGNAYGIHAAGWKTDVTFSGANSSIISTAVSASGEAFGISSGGSSTTTVSNLGSMIVTSKATANGIYAGGSANTSVTFTGANSSVNVAGGTDGGSGDTHFINAESKSITTVTGASDRTKVTFTGTDGNSAINVIRLKADMTGFAPSLTLKNFDVTAQPISGNFMAISATGVSGSTQATVTLDNTLIKGNVTLTEYADVLMNLNNGSAFQIGEDILIDNTSRFALQVSEGSTLSFAQKTELPSNMTTTLSSGSKLAFCLDGFAKDSTIVTSENSIGVTGVKVNLWQEQPSRLSVGDSLTLLTNATGDYAGEEMSAMVKGQGIKKYIYSTYLENTTDSTQGLKVRLSGEEAAEESKSLSEGFIAGTAALMQANDLVSEGAIAAAKTATELTPNQEYVPYVAIQGGHGRYHTGSHVDLNSTQVAAGVAKRFDYSTIGGLLIEGGNSRYTSYNDFTSGELRADGEVKYYGVGIFARHSFCESYTGNAYVDASFGVGRTDQDYRTADILGIPDYHYDIGVTYLKAHATAGYEWDLGKSSINGYLKYLWGCQNGATIKFNGQDVNFDTINSHRVRVGARYTQKIHESFAWYGGLAYEYEFDASAGASSMGLAIVEPDLKGGSAMAELGIKYVPPKADEWMFDLGLEGFTGKKDSLGVRLTAWYIF